MVDGDGQEGGRYENLFEDDKGEGKAQLKRMKQQALGKASVWDVYLQKGPVVAVVEIRFVRYQDPP